MEIGGTDVVLMARPGVPVTEMILRRVQFLWPECVFEDANTGGQHPIWSESVWLYGTGSKEFFVYRDEAAALAWDQDGGTEENLDTMLYFLVEKQPQSGRLAREVTIVCGHPSSDVVQLVEDLVKTFQCSPPGINEKCAA